MAGPFALGVLVEVAPPQLAAGSVPSRTRPVRLSVFGDSDFASNKHFYSGDNGQLLLSAVNWIAEETELVSIERKLLPYPRLVMDQDTRRFLWVSTMGFFLPGVFLLGAFVWWCQR